MATLRDWMTELELYPYSRENFELTKECAEVDLMEKYVESHEFMMEHSEMISGAAITESYLMEAETKEKIEDIKANVEKKKEGIWQKIKAGFVKAWTGFITLLRKLGSKFSKDAVITDDAEIKISDDKGGTDNNKADEAPKESSGGKKTVYTLTADQAKELLDEMEEALKKNNTCFANDALTFSLGNAHSKSKDAPDVKVTGNVDFASFNPNRFEDLISLANASTVAVNITTNNLGTAAGLPVDAKELSEICRKFLASENGYNAEKVLKYIAAETADTYRNKIFALRVDSSLSDVAGQMEQFNVAMATMGSGVDQGQFHYNAKYVDRNGNGTMANVNNVYGKIMICLQATAAVYRWYDNFRSVTNNYLKRVIKVTNSAAAE